VTAIEEGYRELETAQEMERQAAMLCQDFHTWVFNYSDVIEALQTTYRYLDELAGDRTAEDIDLAAALGQAEEALRKAGQLNEL
jgi:hypothetical protein